MYKNLLAFQEACSYNYTTPHRHSRVIAEARLGIQSMRPPVVTAHLAIHKYL